MPVRIEIEYAYNVGRECDKERSGFDHIYRAYLSLRRDQKRDFSLIVSECVKD